MYSLPYSASRAKLTACFTPDTPVMNVFLHEFHVSILCYYYTGKYGVDFAFSKVYSTLQKIQQHQDPLRIVVQILKSTVKVIFSGAKPPALPHTTVRLVLVLVRDVLAHRVLS